MKHYSNRKLMSYDRNKFPFRGIIGTRGYGKSYSASNLLANFYNKIKHIPEDSMNVDDMFIWLRLSKRSLEKMQGRVLDAKVERKHKIVVEEKADKIYFNDRHIGYKLAIADAPAIKGAFWEWTRFKYIIVDEFQRERKEKKTFDVVYNLISILESTCRFTTRLADGYDLPIVLFMGNTVDESVDLLHAFDFIPLDFGTYVLRSHNDVIEYAKNSKSYDQIMEKNPLTRLMRDDDLTFGTKKIKRSTKIMKSTDTGARTFIGYIDLTDHLSYQMWSTQNGHIYIAKDLEHKKYITNHYTLHPLLANKDNLYSVEIHKMIRQAAANDNIYFQSQLIQYAFMNYLR